MSLTIGPNTWVPGRLTLPVDVTTVLGNLVDNAIDAARTGAADAKTVEVELLQDGSTLHITVADSGDGVAPTLSTTCSSRAGRPNQIPAFPVAVASGWRCRGRSAGHWAATCGCPAQAVRALCCAAQSSSPGCRA